MNQFLCSSGRKSCKRATVVCAALKRELAQTADSCCNALPQVLAEAKRSATKKAPRFLAGLLLLA